jgi:hypothetical protein
VPQGGIGQTIATNQILTLNNLQLNKSGGYTFVVLVNNDLKSEVPLGVELDAASFQGPPGGDISIH